MTNFIDKLKNRVQELADDKIEKLKEFAAPEETAKARMVICIACPELIQITKNCKQCGCFMAVKTKLNHAECPLKKW